MKKPIAAESMAMKNNAQKSDQFDHSGNTAKTSGRPSKGDFKFVKSPLDLSKKVKPLPPGKFDPIAAAERQTKQLSVGFTMWLQQDLKNLLSAFRVFSQDPNNEENFQLLNNQIHSIKGNAPVMGAEAAGMIACPLSTMLEGCADHKRAKPIISLSINAICRAIEHKIPPDDQELLELIAQLNLLNKNCKLGKAKTKTETETENIKVDKTDNASNQPVQAAGSANRSPKNECASSGKCPGTCENSCMGAKA